MTSPDAWISSQPLDGDLHSRLLAGERTASWDLANTYFDRLVNWLSSQFPKAHPQDCAPIVNEVLRRLIENPSAYDATRSSLFGYLELATKRRFANFVRDEQRRRHPVDRTRKRKFQVVELSGLAGNENWGTDTNDPEFTSPADSIPEATDDLSAGTNDQFRVRRLLGSDPVELVRRVHGQASSEEQQVIDLLLANPFRRVPTGEISEILGIPHLPEAVQRHEAKKILERVRKRLLREAQHMGRKGSGGSQ